MYTDIHPYGGNEPFIFISYAHKDETLSMPIMQWLHDNGYRIWFDKGIYSGDFASKIAERLENAACVLALLSDNFVDSINCRNEINYAINCKKTILPVYLQPTQLRKGMGLQLVSFHDIRRYELSEAQFYAQLAQSSEIQMAHSDNRVHSLKYTAYICARHCPLDIRVAKELQKKIGSYRIPKGLHPEGKGSFGPVFLDQSELYSKGNLEDATHDALEQSRYLILVCTPETPKSQWIDHSIRYFMEKHGRERIITVLAAGTPEESIPQVLTHDYDAEGKTALQELTPIYIPLADKRENKVLQNLNKEFPRIAAMLLDCHYADLIQRQWNPQSRKRFLSIVLPCLLICMLCIFGIWGLRYFETPATPEQPESTDTDQVIHYHKDMIQNASDEDIILAKMAKDWKPLEHLGYDITVSEVLSYYYSNVFYDGSTVTAENEEGSIQFSVWWGIDANGYYTLAPYQGSIFCDCYINSTATETLEFEKMFFDLITGIQ